MESHIKTARAHGALACLYGLIFLLLVYAMSGVDHGTTEVGMAVTYAIFFGVFAVHLLAALGARRRKPWARFLSMAVAIVMLIGFPVGTILGIYLLYNAAQGWDPPRTHPPSPGGNWPATTRDAG